MKIRKSVTTLMALLATAGLAGASERRDADIDRIQTASTILSQIMSAPDRAIPDSIMSGAKCIAIMPSMLKASFVFGANYGKGVATCRTETGWSAPAFFKLTGGSFGFQAGGQASDLVLIVRTDDGMQHLLQSKFKLGADASAAAGPVGRDAQAMTDLTLRAQVLTYSRSRGLFLGVSLSGGVIKQDQADTQAFYGKDWTYHSVLNGKVPPPPDADVLLKMVEKYAPTPRPKAAPASAAAPAPEPAIQRTGSAQPSASTPTAMTATVDPVSAPLDADSSTSAMPSSSSMPTAVASAPAATTPAATPSNVPAPPTVPAQSAAPDPTPAAVAPGGR
jgi:lipid-binding SYLF domain-containing protein